MKNILIFFSIVLLGLTFSACETDVELFTDHKKTPVIFALLEPQNSVQFFRINPTFIGEGDAREFAGDPSLTNYAEGEIEVTLTNITSDASYKLKDSIGYIDLEDGGIFNPKNRIYYLNTPIVYILDTNTGKVDITNTILIPNHDYRLDIKNVSTGIISTSTITLGDLALLDMTNPARGISQFPQNWISLYNGTDYNHAYSFEFSTDTYTERVLLQFRYYYGEGNEDPEGRVRNVEFEVGETVDLTSNEFQKFGKINFDGERFYNILNAQLDPHANRTGDVIDLYLTAAGPDLETYLTVQNASLSGLSQESPGYSNIDNGLGIFSFRIQKPFFEYKLNDASAKHLFETGSPTVDKFICAKHGTQNNSSGVTPCR